MAVANPPSRPAPAGPMITRPFPFPAPPITKERLMAGMAVAIVLLLIAVGSLLWNSSGSQTATLQASPLTSAGSVPQGASQFAPLTAVGSTQQQSNPSAAVVVSPPSRPANVTSVHDLLITLNSVSVLTDKPAQKNWKYIMVDMTVKNFTARGYKVDLVKLLDNDGHSFFEEDIRFPEPNAQFGTVSGCNCLSNGEQVRLQIVYMIPKEVIPVQLMLVNNRQLYGYVPLIIK